MKTRGEILRKKGFEIENKELLRLKLAKNKIQRLTRQFGISWKIEAKKIGIKI